MENVIMLAIAAGAAVLVAILMIPIVGIMTMHKRKMEEMRMKGRIAIADETRAAIEALRQEFAALRDTTTQYDVSFDTALHRIESRVGNLEQRMQQSERQQETQRYASVQESASAIQ